MRVIRCQAELMVQQLLSWFCREVLGNRAYSPYLAPTDFHLLWKLKTSLEDKASPRVKIFKTERISISTCWHQPSMMKILENSSIGMASVSIFTVNMSKNNSDCTLSLVIKLFCYPHLSAFYALSKVERKKRALVKC